MEGHSFWSEILHATTMSLLQGGDLLQEQGTAAPDRSLLSHEPIVCLDGKQDRDVATAAMDDRWAGTRVPEHLGESTFGFGDADPQQTT